MNVVVDEWLNHRASGNLTCRPGLVVVLSSTKFETSWITKQMQVNILYGHGEDDWLGCTEMVYNKPKYTSLIERAERGLCFRLSVWHFVCLSVSLTIPANTPYRMSCNLESTNLVQRRSDVYVRVIIPPSISKWWPFFGSFS